MIRPIRTQVLVKAFESEGVSTGGIIIPDSVKQVSNKVKIIAVGGGTKENPMRLKVGDVVLRVKDWGTEIEEDGVTYFILDQTAILAKA